MTTPFHNTQLLVYAHAHSNPHTMHAEEMMESHELEESGAIQLIDDNYDVTLSPFSLSSSSSYLLSVKGSPIKLWMSPKFRLVSDPVPVARTVIQWL